MKNAPIIISVKEQNIALNNFQNSVEIMLRKTLEVDIKYVILTLAVW